MFSLSHGRQVEAKVIGLSWLSICLIFLFRLFLCCTIRTVEAPDAWWQSVEVAYYLVFGKGSLTWEWKNGLRSIAFPGMYAVPFYVLKLLNMDTAWSVWVVQQLQQALILTAIDVSVFRIGAQIDMQLKQEMKKVDWNPSKDTSTSYISMPFSNNGGSVASFALTLSLTNWYMAFAGVRAYSSVLEALCILLVLQQRSYIGYLAWSGMACVIRVTSAVIIAPLMKFYVGNAISQRGVVRGLLYIFKWGLFMLVLILGLCTFADRCFFGQWIFTYVEFLRFNIIEGASSHYGVHPWYFFVFPFLPFLIGPHILFIVYMSFWCVFRFTSGVVVSLCTRYLVGIMTWTLICYSWIPHKETRFIFPLIPFCCILSALFLARRYQRSKCIRYFHFFGIGVNIALIILMGYVFRRGPGDVMAEIRDGPRIHRLDIVSTCYTTPGYSFIHGKVEELGLIDCPYQTNKLTKQRVLTEDDMFRRYPKDYVLWKYTGVHTFNASDARDTKKIQELKSSVLPKSAPLPDVMVMFRYTTKKIQHAFLDKNDYTHYRSFFHTPITFFSYEDIYMDMWVRRIRDTIGVRWLMKSVESTITHNRDAGVAYCLQEQDDAILCAFGPDFFNGARTGAACGGIFTLWMTCKAFKNLREEHHLLDAKIPNHLRENTWTISRGFRYRPFFTLGCIAMGLTTTLKTVKLVLASYRYNEFVADDVGFELLLKMCEENSDNYAKLDSLVDSVKSASKQSTSVLDLKADSAGERNLTASLLAKSSHEMTFASSLVDRRPPTFWDGVAVGLFGSVMDCYLPSKPVYCYYGMRCGMRH